MPEFLQYLVKGYFRQEIGADTVTEPEVIRATTGSKAEKAWKNRPAANGGKRQYDYIKVERVG